MIIHKEASTINVVRMTLPSILGLIAFIYLSLIIMNKYDNAEQTFIDLESEITEYGNTFESYDTEERAKLADYIINKENDAYKEIYSLIKPFKKIFRSIPLYALLFIMIQTTFIFFHYIYRNKTRDDVLDTSILYAILFWQLAFTTVSLAAYIVNYDNLRYEVNIWLYFSLLTYSLFIIYCGIYKYIKTLLAILAIQTSCVFYIFFTATGANIIFGVLHLYFLTEITYCSYKLKRQ